MRRGCTHRHVLVVIVGPNTSLKRPGAVRSCKLHDSHVLVRTVNCHFAESVAVAASARAGQPRRTVVPGRGMLLLGEIGDRRSVLGVVC